MRKILLALAILIILSITLLLFSPNIASTSIGKRIIESAISQRMSGDIHIGSWQFSWFGPQIMRNGQFESDKIKFSFTEIQAKLPFWAFLNLTNLNTKILKSLDGSASLKNGQIILYSDDESDVYIQNIDLNLYGNEGEDIHFDLKSDSQVDEIIGSILINGTIASPANFFNSPFPTLVKVITVNFPTKSLDIFFKAWGKKTKNKFFNFLKKNPNFFASFFGAKINANLLIDGKNNENSVIAEIVSTNLKTNLDATIENRNLYLNKNLSITFNQIDEFSNNFIRNMNPLFVTSIGALNPVTLEIFKEGFQLPFDMQIENISIPKAVLDVGKLKCQNGKLLSAITALAKLKEQNNDLIIWCTPLSFQIRNKIFATKRLDALIENSIHVCTLGDANLSNHKLDMIFGIPKDTLEKIFQIKNLPNDFVLQIPLKGTFEKPTVKIKQAIAKLAMLVASQKSKEISTLLKILKKLDQENFPPPNRPYPWD